MVAFTLNKLIGRCLLLTPLLLFTCNKPQQPNIEDLLCGKWQAIQVKTVLKNKRFYEYHYVWEYRFKADGSYELQISVKETGVTYWWERGDFMVVGDRIYFRVTQCPDRDFVGGSYALTFEYAKEFLRLGGRVFHRI